MRKIYRICFVALLIIMAALSFNLMFFIVENSNTASAAFLENKQVKSFIFVPKIGNKTYARIYMTGDESVNTAIIPTFRIEAESDATYWYLTVKISINDITDEAATPIYEYVQDWALRCSKHELGGNWSYNVPINTSLLKAERSYSIRISLWGGSNLNYSQSLSEQSYSINLNFDTKAPSIVGSVPNGGLTNDNFTITATDKNFSTLLYKAPGSTSTVASFVTSKTINSTDANGVWEFYAKDKAGNESSKYYVTLDTVAPVISSNISKDAFTNQEFTISASDSIRFKSLYYKRPGDTSWQSQNTPTYTVASGSTNGLYVFKAEDAAGNMSAEYSVNYDDSVPILTGQTNGNFTNEPFTITAEDSNFIMLYYKTPNAENFTALETPTYSVAATAVNGKYDFYAIDKAGNQSSIMTVYFDTDKPTLSGIANGGFYKGKVVATWTDMFLSLNSLDSITVNYSRSTTASFPTSATTTYSNGTSFSLEGNYLFRIEDRAGNYTEYRVTLDNSKPTLTLSGINSLAFSNTQVRANWGTTVGGVGAQRMNTSDTLSVMWARSTNSSFPTSATTSYSAAFAEEGNYLIRIQDKAGNLSDYRFTIDKTKPMLSGIADGAFYTGSIAAIWNASALTVNANDFITVRYSRSSTGVFPSATSVSYERGEVLLEDGNYYFSIQDAAGNSNYYRVTLDNSKPTLTLSGINSLAFSNTQVSANWGTTVGGVGAQRMNASDTLSVMWARSTTSSFPSSATTSYSAAFAEEGNYLIRIQDKAGNLSDYRFTIDKTAPQFSLSGLVAGLAYNASKDGFYATWVNIVGGVGTQRVNDNDILSAYYSLNSSTIYPTSATMEYSKNIKLQAEGYYLIRLYDAAGNFSEEQCIVDFTAPTVPTIAEYLNYGFSFTATDHHGSTIYFSHDGVANTTMSGEVVVELATVNFGNWTFYATDDLGNRTDTQTVNLYSRFDFGNLDNIKNGYKTPVWYTVNLPARIFTDIDRIYTFATRDAAMSFAFNKEWEYRVETLANGWSYVNITNESVTQSYTNREELNAAVTKYATSYVSGREVLQLGNNQYTNPTDENGVTRADALTRQSLEMPEMLSDYANLPLYLIQHNYVFVTPVAGVSGNTRQMSVQYLANDLMRVSTSAVNLAYEVKFEKALESAGVQYRQGYYLINESDRCGNEQIYIVYLDTDTPTLNGKVTLGSGEEQTIAFNNDYVTKNANVMLYVSMTLQSIFDNIDDFSVICVSGRGLADVCFAQGDELPTLTLENGYYGKYIINVYDRSMNYISFTVRIAGDAPTLKHTSLTNETRCTLTIEYDSLNNGITAIELFKVTYQGEYVPLSVDSDDTPISAATLSYVLRVGGKYVVRFADIFGRIIETDPIFYMKGLPVGSLKGVRENGITKNDVSFEFYDGDGLHLYRLVPETKTWEICDDVMSLTVKEGYTIAQIVADVETSQIYKFFLFVEADLNLFTEYRFEIDCVAPIAQIYTEAGGEVAQEAVIKENFSVKWNEGTARYYSKNNPLGSYSETTYNKGTIISKAGTYVFTITDGVGNVTTFNVTLDNLVSYTIDGNFSTLADGSIISKTNITLTVSERTSVFRCTTTNGLNVMNGEVLSEDGTYCFTVVDVVGNEFSIVIIIDKLPPVPIIKTASGVGIVMNGATNKAFTVSCEEEEVLIFIKSGAQYIAYDGVALDAEGVFAFRMTDRMNNSCMFTVTIDRTVKYTVRGTYQQIGENQYITRFNFTLTIDEAFSRFEVEGTQSFTSDERVSQEGEYRVSVVDAVGNETIITFIIDKTAPSAVVKAADNSVITSGKTNQNFTVTCDEDGSTLKMSRKSTSTGSVYLGDELSESGMYYFTVSDFIGNETSFTVEIDLVLNYVIGGVYKTTSNGAYISKTALSVTIKEDYTRFEVEGAQIFVSGEAITKEGRYTVTAQDIAGNVVVLELIIDKTMPMFEIKTISETIVGANAVINEGFTVASSEDGAVITYSMNGTKYIDYDGSVRSVGGVYYFIVSDFIGNEARFTVHIDLDVSFSVKGNYKQSGNVYVSRTSLTLEVEDDYRRFDVRSNNTTKFAAGEAVTKEGHYQVTVEDKAGNVVVLELIIDKTAPTVQIRTQDDVDLLPNTSSRYPFNVMCGEDGSTITISTNGSKFLEYTGAVLEGDNVYYFIVSDFVGNEVSFTITIDTVVSFVVKGYSRNVGNMYASKSSLTIDIKEDYKRFDVNSGEIIPSEAITKEGKFTATIEDYAGNVVTLELIIDKTAPIPYIINTEGDGVAINGTSRLPFFVATDEENGSISFSTNGTKYYEYTGAMLEGENKYYFIAADYVGNEVSFNVTLDASVSFRVKGTYALDGTAYVSRYGFTVEVNEEYSQFVVVSDNDVSFSAGERIAAEGRYDITILDAVGNVVVVRLVIDQTAPVISASIENSGITKDTVTVRIEGGATSYYTSSNSAEKVIIDTECFISQSGTYTIVSSDIAGNESKYKFTIDGAVDVTISPSIISGQIVSSEVSFDFGEKVSIILTFNNAQIDYRSLLREVGNYVLIAEDEQGNVFTIAWTIIPLEASSYDLTVPNGYTVSGTVNGEAVRFENGIIDLSKDGVYSLVFSGENGEYTLEFTVDTVAPTVEITQEKKQVLFTKADKADVTYELYLDGKLINCKPNEAITARGHYKLVVTDALGNSSEYSFALDYINNYGIIVIALGVALVLVVLVVVFAYRRRQRVK